MRGKVEKRERANYDDDDVTIDNDNDINDE